MGDFRTEVGGHARVGTILNIGSAEAVVLPGDRPAPPAELPAALPDFTGRARELDELRALRRSGAPAVVLIVGPPGVGKSAVALRLAHELAGEHPDGQLYRDLRGEERRQASGTVLGQFLRALGASPADIPDDPAGRAAAYRTLLAGRRALVLLDNAADESQVRPLLPGASDCLVLVTSRNALAALEGAVTCRLDVLDPADAVDLLRRIVGTDRVAADPAGSEAIVEHCGRLPLAVRIAGARLRARADWTPTAVAERLADVRRRLRELRVGDLDVRASFDLSYRDLDPDSARLFRRLGGVPGPTFSAELASALDDLPQPDTEELLDRLVLDQLVVPAGVAGHYQMHDLLGLFAGEKVHEAGEDVPRLLESILVWYHSQLEAAPDRVAWLDAEAANLSSLLVLSRELELDRYTAVMAYQLGIYAMQTGLRTEWAEALRMGLDAARRLGDRLLQARYLLPLGEWHASHNEWAEAAECFVEALQAIEAPAAHPELVGSLHNRLARAYRALGQHGESERELTASAAAIAAMDPGAAETARASFDAETLLEAGRADEAASLLQRLVLPTLRRVEPLWAQARLRLQLAEAYVAAHRDGDAVPQLLHCRTLARDHGVRSHGPKVQLLLGEAYQRLGRRDRAREAWQEGMALAELDDHPFELGGMTYNLAADYALADDRDGAEELYRRSADAFASGDMQCNRAGALNQLAHLRWRFGDRAGADAAWTEALAGLRTARDSSLAEKNRRLIERTRAELAGPTTAGGKRHGRGRSGRRGGDPGR
jgi:tetratricopeptide (TPR) repeat protein/DNA polymerase III delta prime subunit